MSGGHQSVITQLMADEAVIKVLFSLLLSSDVQVENARGQMNVPLNFYILFLSVATRFGNTFKDRNIPELIYM